MYADDDAALLRAHFVERTPEYVPLAGALVLCANETRLDLAPFVSSVALPANILRETTRVETRARDVITVENAASFAELAAQVITPRTHTQNFIAVYIGGFASPSVLAFLKTLRAANLQIRHWGDLDVGGLRILAHLRKHLGAVKTLGMDVETFAAHQLSARRLNTREHGALEMLRREESLQDCIPLMDALLAANEKLEQEAVRAEIILYAPRA